MKDPYYLFKQLYNFNSVEYFGDKFNSLVFPLHLSNLVSI